jgi:hypothetical protein
MVADPRPGLACPRRPRRGLAQRIRIGGLATVLLMAAPTSHAACTVQEPTDQSRRVLCTIDDGANLRFIRLEARFDGFHDDSLATLSLELDGTELPCSAQDRVELSGESGDEGEVTLFCRVRVVPSEGRPRALAVLLRFRHAEFSGVRLVPESAPGP